MPHTVVVSDKPLQTDTALSAVADNAHGGVDMFIGMVRDNHMGNTVTGMTYDIHIPLAEKIIADICHDAGQKWQGIKCYVAHYKGYLKVGEISIIIAVSSPHRAESFEACRYIIEHIKMRAPIWKQEHYIDGNSDWLPGHSLQADGQTDVPSNNQNPHHNP